MKPNTISIIDLKQMKNEIDSILDSIIRNKEQLMNSDAIFSPNLDIIESENNIKIHIELPGLKKDDIDIHYYKGYIEVKGRKSRDGDIPCDMKFLRIERTFGDFVEIVEISKAINAKSARAFLENGILTIILPKITEKRGKIKIDIE